MSDFAFDVLITLDFAPMVFDWLEFHSGDTKILVAQFFNYSLLEKGFLIVYPQTIEMWGAVYLYDHVVLRQIQVHPIEVADHRLGLDFWISFLDSSQHLKMAFTWVEINTLSNLDLLSLDRFMQL